MDDLDATAASIVRAGATRENGGQLIVRCAVTQLGKPYSEQSPQGSDGDGHDWAPGMPWPTYFDCSGLDYTAARFVGVVISNGTANDQWVQHIGGVVPPDKPLLPGDFGAFLGSDLIAGYAGHTGIVESYSHETQSGIMVNAADVAQGVCRSPFFRYEQEGVLATLGFYRPANALRPAPVQPPPEPDPTPPTPEDLKRRHLVALSTPEQAQGAIDNGWPLFWWTGGRFMPVPAPDNVKHTFTEYANENWLHTRPAT